MRDRFHQLLTHDILAASQEPDFELLMEAHIQKVTHDAVRRLVELYRSAQRKNPAFTTFAAENPFVYSLPITSFRASRHLRRAQARHQGAIAARWVRKHRYNPELLAGFLDPSLPGCFDEVGIYFLTHSIPINVARDEKIAA